MSKTIKEQLLNLPDIEIKERKKVRKDYYFYKGTCRDKEVVKDDKATIGQNWVSDDSLDYTPTQEIRNKVKPLLKKQARFMFGKEPTITFKPFDTKDKPKCEELRQFIDLTMKENKFWKETRKAFLMSTIKKRVLLRVEANPNMPIVIKYENIEEFHYKEINGKLVEVSFYEEDLNNVYIDKDDEKIYYIHKYYYKSLDETKEITCFLNSSTYKGADLETPIEVKESDTGLTMMPCWLIKNGGELGELFGESDLEDITDIQTQYNKRISDYADALRFQMFGAEAVIDGKEEDVNNLTIAPGALHAIRTDEFAAEKGKQATLQRIEYNMGNSTAINSYLDRADSDMNFILDMPSLKELRNIPSAKAMKYLYNDLIARCEEKWSDWGPVLEDLIAYIIEVGKMCYCGCFNDEWKNLKYTKVFKHNYPLPSDEEDTKTLALKEVDAKVRSRKSYIRDFTDEEDAETTFEEIVEENVKLVESETTDMFSKGVSSELDDTNKSVPEDGQEE